MLHDSFRAGINPMTFGQREGGSLNQSTLHRYFLDGMPSYIGDLIPNQIEQAWIRIAACLICGTYITIHPNDLATHALFLAIIGIVYWLF